MDADDDITLGGLSTTGEIQITTASAIVDGGNAHIDILGGATASACC